MITSAILKGIMPSCSDKLISAHVDYLNEAMNLYAINTKLRQAAFIANVAHETGSLQWMREIWGPTDQQKKYDPPSNLANQLGNTVIGDGKKFKGRGAFQITGRANYEKYGKLLGLSLLETPELAEVPQFASKIAGAFWNSHNLNKPADLGDIKGIRKVINGGLNGYEEVLTFYNTALQLL